MSDDSRCPDDPDALPEAEQEGLSGSVADDSLVMSVAVRELCDFTARRGDLDHRFTPAPSSREGIDGHAQVVARRGEGYRSEVAVEGTLAGLHLRGRIDGVADDGSRLEEIKTHRGKKKERTKRTKSKTREEGYVTEWK